MRDQKAEPKPRHGGSPGGVGYGPAPERLLPPHQKKTNQNRFKFVGGYLGSMVLGVRTKEPWFGHDLTPPYPALRVTVRKLSTLKVIKSIDIRNVFPEYRPCRNDVVPAHYEKDKTMCRLIRMLPSSLQWKCHKVGNWFRFLVIPKGAKIKLFEEYLKPHGPTDCTWRDVLPWRIGMVDYARFKQAGCAVVIYKGKAYQGEI